MDITTIFYDHFLPQLRGQSDRNQTLYQQRLKTFLDQHGAKAPHDISRADVNQWLAGLDPDYALATMAGIRQAIKAFWRYCERAGLVETSPAGHLVIGSTKPRYLKLPPETDVQRISRVAQAWLSQNEIVRVRDSLTWLLCQGSGPRIQEIQRLRKSEAVRGLRAGPDSEGVYRIISRGKSGEVVICFGRVLALGLKHWLTIRPHGGPDICFCSSRPPYQMLTRSGITGSFKRLATAAGVERPILSHALRHRAGHRTAQDIDPKAAARLLNHKDWYTAATAVAYYCHPNDADVSRAVNRLVDTETMEIAEFFGII